MSKLFPIPECSDTQVSITVCVEHTAHCTRCGAPGGSHFVGGSRPDARIICDAAARQAYLTLIKDNASPGRRFREVPDANV